MFDSGKPPLCAPRSVFTRAVDAVIQEDVIGEKRFSPARNRRAGQSVRFGVRLFHVDLRPFGSPSRGREGPGVRERATMYRRHLSARRFLLLITSGTFPQRVVHRRPHGCDLSSRESWSTSATPPYPPFSNHERWLSYKWTSHMRWNAVRIYCFWASFYYTFLNTVTPHKKSHKGHMGSFGN